jgi:hypothetical protein
MKGVRDLSEPDVGMQSLAQQDGHQATVRAMAKRLGRFENKHAGERLVLVCNGPSLNQSNLSLLRGEHVMGMNKIYFGLRRFSLALRYYIAVNPLVISQSASHIAELCCIKFLPFRNVVGCPSPNALTYHFPLRAVQGFYKNLRLGIDEGPTVTYAALQVAFFLGFKKVVIVGMDHRYTFEGNPNEVTVMAGSDPNHFDEKYFCHQQWNNPDLPASEKAYERARQVFEDNGREIVDCTVDGACPVFRKMALEEVLR